MEVLLVVVAIVFLALVFRLVAGGMDHGRIHGYISERSGRAIHVHWNPFGKGWFGEKNARIYQVRYEDADGNIHQATCKTSLLAGVFFTEDQIVSRTCETNASSREAQLEQENRQLRQQLEQLRAERGR
jgi:hypothetical protein